MGRTRAASFLVFLVLAAPAPAEITERDLEAVGETNATYENTVSGRGYQTEVIYLRPSADFQPDADINIKVPEPPPESGENRNRARWTYGLIFGAILAAILYVLLRHGGSMSVAFSSAPREGSRADDAGDDRNQEMMSQPIDRFLESLRAMADRREALILLVSRALERAADANDLRLGRAQTARDVVRIIPGKWPHKDVLGRLVRQAEIVHFGGRDLAEDTWQECLTAAEPIFQRVRA